MDELKRIVVIHDFSEAGLERIFGKLDMLHDLASEGRLNEATSLAPSEVVGWLEDIVFTAEETIREIDARAPWAHVLFLLEEICVDESPSPPNGD